MPPLSLTKKNNATIRLFLHLVLNGETAQKDMPSILNVTPGHVKRVVKKARENNFIQEPRHRPIVNRGLRRNYYTLTLEGLIIALAYNPELWDHYYTIASAPRNRSLLPLIFGKLHLFKGKYIESELTLDMYLLRRLQIAVHRAAEPLWEDDFTKQIRRKNMQAQYSKLSESLPEALAKKELDSQIQHAHDMVAKRRLDQEIYLYVYFDLASNLNPFTIYPCIGMDMARKIWETPIGSPSDITPMFSPKIVNSIMKVAKKDPELFAFFESVVKNRIVYAESTARSASLLKIYWDDSDIFIPI